MPRRYSSGPRLPSVNAWANDYIAFRGGNPAPTCTDRSVPYCYSDAERNRAGLGWWVDCPACKRPANCD